MSKKIAVIGSGYVGLVTASCLADSGNTVTCVDNNPDKIERLKKGEVIIYEPGLDKIFERNINKGRLFFTINTIDAVKKSDIIFFALPTPMGSDFKADLTAVHSVCNQIKDHLKSYKVIVNKSTVPVGTGKEIKAILQTGENPNFDIVSNPEFLKEGAAIDDFQKPERIVIGSDSEKAKRVMLDLYTPFVMQGNPIFCMSIESAEVTKYASNAFLATKISFVNELANFCEIVGANIDEVRKGMGTDSRIGNKFLYPGLGYGGSCFPKDVKAFIQTGKQHHHQFKILESVEEVNKSQKDIFFNKIKSYFNNQLQGKKIAVWGLAFKANTDDIRESKGIYLVKELSNNGAEVYAFDPEAISTTKKEIGDMITYCNDEYECLTDADALVIATEWNEFRNPDWDEIMKRIKTKVIFDGKNIFDHALPTKYNFKYFSVGR